jgi:membrane glycosyltransferase
MLMLLGIIAALISNHEPIHPDIRNATTADSIKLFVVSMSLLLLPKLWGYTVLLRQPRRLAAHGGLMKAAGSVMLETIVSILIAPIMMVFHVTFVLFVLLGRQVQWTRQQREETSTTFDEAFASHGPHTIYGLAATILVILLIPDLFWWLSPVLFGLIVSIPVSMVLSSVNIGQDLMALGLLSIVEETEAPRILRDQRDLLKAYKTLEKRKLQVDPFLQVIVDPAFNAMHRGMLKTSRDPGLEPREVQVEALQRVALYGGPERMSHADKMMLLNAETALVWLHKAAWTQWSTETLAKIVRCV